MYFKQIGSIAGIEVIAKGNGIRERARLRKIYKARNWRKLKGVSLVKLANGTICRAELHWYEAHGAGKTEMKIKRLLH